MSRKLSAMGGLAVPLAPVAMPLALLLALPASGMGQGRGDVADWCEESHGDDRDERYCEVREQTLPASARVSVDAGKNGGIRVAGWERGEVLLQSKVQARADSPQRAREIAQEVRIVAQDEEIRAQGPKTEDDEWWSVSYRLSVPTLTDLELETTNGGISIESVRGNLQFQATNGGVSLADVGGDVRGSTTNGGLSIELTGSEWQGEGLDVRTTNGGVRLEIPNGYSAQLETGTVNGGLEIDFPVTVQGRISRTLNVELGSGGKLIRARTTNGGVKISRS